MGIKILLADDSVTAQNMGKKILSEAGHEVVTVSNGAAAAKKISEVKPDLVLLDVFMPGYSGLELCEKLRKSSDTAKLPVLLTVGRMEPYSPQEGARVKADGVIVKPFESSDLIAAVDRLAQKLNPGKTPDYARTIRISAPANLSDEAWKQEIQKKLEQSRAPEPAPEAQAEPVEQEGPISATQIFGSKPPETYERTMRLDAKQIAELLKQSAAQNAAEAGAAPTAPAEEFHVAPPAHPPEFHGADASTPAFGAELPHTPSPQASPTASVPSYMGEYLPDHTASQIGSEPVSAAPELKPAEDLEDTVVMAPGHAPTPVKPISPESAVQRFAADSASASVGSAEGLELTAAAPVSDVTIVHEGALETTLQGSDAPTIVLRDPALIDQQLSSTAFPTHFAGSEPPASEAAGDAAASEDEFESRLKAAMACYSEPATELPAFGQTETAAPLGLHESAEEAFETKLESGDHGVEAPAEASGDISLETSWSIPQASSSLEHAVNALDQAELERTQIFEMPKPGGSGLAEIHYAEPTPVEAVSHAILETSEPEPAPTLDTDDAVIQRMRESFSGEHVDAARLIESSDSSEPSVAVAAAAIPAPSPAPSGHEAETEIARALAAAVGSGSPSESMVHSQSEAPSSTDANRVAAAVERVMKRELPNLIWKIMAELDLGK